MNEINPLLNDLALILIVAGVVTVIFKALKQPLVLGYISAGILTGPYISFMPTASNIESIEFWGKIGVVFLLFGLGLEFSFKKIKKVGGAGFITVFMEVVMMFCMGFLMGRILGWSWVSSLFLGGMLTISSTSIIIKAFDDLGLKNKKFTQLVFGTLVAEDLVAILMMVVLPALVIGHTFNGADLVNKVVGLAMFLLLWFTGGVFFIPQIFKKIKHLVTDETLIVIGLGLCLGMVVITVRAGFSEALGAFVMGSILAGTAQSEKIVRLTKSIKDFFGAIFFVSVGMLVDPRAVVEYWPQVLLISLTVVLMKPLSATVGLLFSGQTLKIALQSGMCLCQIGEFSFIIATIGRELDATPAYLYPVVVTVSILTTFITPYWIKLGGPAYDFIYNRVKPQWRVVIERLGTGRTTLNREGEWNKLLKSYLLRLFIYVGWIGFVIFFFATVMKSFVTGYLGDTFRSNLLLFTGNILLMLPFLYGLLRRKDNDGIFDRIWADGKFSRGPLLFMMILKYLIAVIAISIPASLFITKSSGAIMIICTLVILTTLMSNKIRKYYGRIENQFLTNLHSEGGRQGFVMPRVLADEMHIDKCEIEPNSFLSGKTIGEVHRAKEIGAFVIQIGRGNEIIDLPLKTQTLYPGDHLLILGTDQQIRQYQSLAEELPDRGKTESDIEMEMFQITLNESSIMIGQPANISLVRERFGVLIIGLEKADSNTFLRPTFSQVIEPGDTVWVVGNKQKIMALNPEIEEVPLP